mgnify:CR=1 FL=1
MIALIERIMQQNQTFPSSDAIASSGSAKRQNFWTQMPIIAQDFGSLLSYLNDPTYRDLRQNVESIGLGYQGMDYQHHSRFCEFIKTIDEKQGSIVYIALKNPMTIKEFQDSIPLKIMDFEDEKLTIMSMLDATMEEVCESFGLVFLGGEDLVKKWIEVEQIFRSSFGRIEILKPDRLEEEISASPILQNIPTFRLNSHQVQQASGHDETGRQASKQSIKRNSLWCWNSSVILRKFKQESLKNETTRMIRQPKKVKNKKKKHSKSKQKNKFQ